MELVRVIVTAPHQYYGRQLAVDQEYDCEAPLVEPFQKLGWARPKGAPAPDVGSYQTRALTAGSAKKPKKAAAK